MSEASTDYSIILEILIDILGDCRKFNDYTLQAAFDCPVCSYELKGLEYGDGKGNLEVNLEKNIYHCWACGETNETHGSIYKLIKTFGSKKQLKQYELFLPEISNDKIKKNFNYIKLPEEYISLSNVNDGIKLTHYYKQAINYLRTRNINDEIIKRFNIGFCYNGHYANRIIIPSYDENLKLNYFVGRSYLNNTKLKYLNPHIEKENIIWNEHLINWNLPIYIVEGPFDSLFLENSIALLGKVMSEYLFSSIYTKSKNDIIIVLDGDAYNDAEKLFLKLNGGRLIGKVWLAKLPKEKDIADLCGKLNKEDIIQLF